MKKEKLKMPKGIGYGKKAVAKYGKKAVAKMIKKIGRDNVSMKTKKSKSKSKKVGK
jgi:hypothetical protein